MRAVQYVQGVYYFLTGAWPLIHVQSFMQVTGYKTDIWLVKTVSVLVLAISFYLFMNLKASRQDPAFYALVLPCTFGIAAVEIFYVVSRVISLIYILDAAIQFFFFLCYGLMAIRLKKQPG